MQWIEQAIQDQKVLAIMGPTASGKSGLSMALAQKVPAEIISVDSALIYRGMDIGTAKPTPEERMEVPHHLIDICLPEETFSASEFVKTVHCLVADIFARGKLPILVGGTMMYYHALQQGMAKLPSADETIRAQLAKQWQKHPDSLYEKLQQVDPKICERIHGNDQQRIFRALEVFELTGKPLSLLQQEGQGNGLTEFKLIKIGLLPTDRARLHQQIEARFKQMLAQGFIEEVKTLAKNPKLHADLPSIRSVGYRQAWAFLHKEYDEATFVEKSIIATRQLAKRQMTWLRKEQNVIWFDPFEEKRDTMLEKIMVCYLQEDH